VCPVALAVCLAALACSSGAVPCRAQENPLGNVTTPTPPPPPVSPDAQKPMIEGGQNAAALGTSIRDSRIRVNVNLVQVPATVTDPMDRLVTGLEKENFSVFDDNQQQTIKYFSSEDAPITIGVVFDLSGSMSSKFVRARKALTEFLRTSNPQDEISDGGDNRSRYTEGELRSVVREADVQIYSIGIFDSYAATTEEQLGPILLNDICDMTGGRLFKVSDVGELSDIAQRISSELRNQYVIGYTPTQVKRDGNWRKLKVRLTPPPGLPQLTVHFRQGYYAPSE